MKVAPVSADLLIKLALGAAVIGVAVWAVRRTTTALGEAIPDLPDFGAWASSAGHAIGSAADSASSAFWAAEDWTRDTFANATERRDAVLSSIGTAVNPASDQNLAYRGVNALGSSLTGDSHFTLGGWLYDLLNPAPPPPDQGIGYGAIDARRIDRSLGY